MSANKLTLLLTLFLFSCSQGSKEFKELSQVSSVQGNTGTAHLDFCTISPTEIDTKIKLIFQVDYSGSNIIFAGGRPPTDPDRVIRHIALQNWLMNRNNVDNEYYTYLWFTRNESQLSKALDEDIHPDFPFVQDTQTFADIVEWERVNEPDGGGTPFKAALNQIIDIIKMDAEKARTTHLEGGQLVQSVYPIAFTADGVQTDATKPEVLDIILNDLLPLTNHPRYGPYISQITLNTAYYYTEIDLPEAREIMIEMAEVGQGDFYEYDENEIIDFDQLADILIKRVSTKLTDVIINNTNTTWDIASRSLLADSDGDGLPDVVELMLGSDPFKYDSDGNGVGDGVEFAVDRHSRPCRDPNCNPDRAHRIQGCFDLDGEIIDSNLDGMADCEKRLLGANPYQFDTNGNGLPDWLAFKFGLPLTRQDNDNRPSPPAHSVDSDRDGISDLEEVRINSSPLVKNSELEGLKVQVYDQQMVSYDPRSRVACYNLVVDDIYMNSSSDTIRAYLIENETTQTGRKYLRVIEKQARNGQVYFSREDFSEAPLIK